MDLPADEDPFIVELLACQPLLLRVALNLTRNPPDADDLVQDTLLRAIRKRARYTPDTNLPAWLRTMLVHLYYDGGRRKQQRQEIAWDERDESHHSLGSVEEDALNKLDLDQAMADSDPLLRMMVRDDLTYQEAAKRLGVKVVTMNGRVYRARQEVRERRREREEGQAE